MKKIYTSLLFLFPIALHAECELSQNSDGEYLISSYSDFTKMAREDCPNDATYRLTQDISGKGEANFEPISSFSGKLHGNAHVISDVKISAGTYNVVGIFKNLSGTIDSIGFDKFEVSGGRYTGLIAGMSTPTISHVFITNSTIRGENMVGGFVGQNSGTIQDSYIDNSTIQAYYEFGGITGQNNGTIERTYAINDYEPQASNYKSFGGITGINEGTITASYASFYSIKSPKSIADSTTKYSKIDNLSKLIDRNKYDSTEFKQSASQLWDFKDKWTMVQNHTRPMLRMFMQEIKIYPMPNSMTYNGKPYDNYTVLIMPNQYDNSIIRGSFGFDGPAYTAVNVGEYELQVTTNNIYSNQRGYYFTGGSTTVSITPKALTVSGITANDKKYDSTTTATLSGTPVLDGLVEGDTLSLTGDAIAEFENAEPGKSKKVIISGLEIEGDSLTLANYTFSLPELKADINEEKIDVIFKAPRTRMQKPQGTAYDIRGAVVPKRNKNFLKTFQKR